VIDKIIKEDCLVKIWKKKFRGFDTDALREDRYNATKGISHIFFFFVKLGKVL